jgi:hypothetical protein
LQYFAGLHLLLITITHLSDGMRPANSTSSQGCVPGPQSNGRLLGWAYARHIWLFTGALGLQLRFSGMTHVVSSPAIDTCTASSFAMFARVSAVNFNSTVHQCIWGILFDSIVQLKLS